MGNTGPKPSTLNQNNIRSVDLQREELCQNQTLSSSFTGRSFLSFNSYQSSGSVSRPWAKISRRRWNESTLTLPYQVSKTSWPVSQTESFFLPEFPVLPSTQQNKFTHLNEISQGAFGSVYKVSNKKGDLYALKILAKSKVIKEGAIKQVKEEVQIQKACGHHPFIVNCPFHWQTKKRLYIVTDYVAGGELYQLLKIYTVLPVALVKLYVAQLALAIDFLHNAGVIYRDLKPENILLDVDGNIQLIDFGLSKWLSYGKTTKTFCGTLLYMAPELMSNCEYGHAVDWWSLGIICCLMLTGKYPSTKMNLGEEKAAVVYLPQEDLDKHTCDFISRLLQVDPTKRLRSIRTLQNISFFHKFDFEEVKQKKTRPKSLLPVTSCFDNAGFEGFDENFVTLEN